MGTPACTFKQLWDNVAGKGLERAGMGWNGLNWAGID